ncbi:M15 family metallopeptidase [Aeromicrobium sp.]|nr:M15 family metallopeptidase [Candidatus Saccharibacteria bacterium]
MRLKTIVLIILCLLLGVGFVVWKSQTADAPSFRPESNKTTPAAVKPKPFDKTMYSLTNPASVWVIANKQHPLGPKEYVPADLVVPNVSLRVPGNESMQLRQVAAGALETMFSAAKSDGIAMTLSSGYRSYTYQVNLYNGYVASQGQVAADTQSARPGFSEHQTGLAVDVEPSDRTCEVEACFGGTPAGVWVKAHAYEYGFIIRYPTGKEDITGYEPEPWHLRYIGKDLAFELNRTGVTTLEEFFGISGGKSYVD